jgi:hypothetical protein
LSGGVHPAYPVTGWTFLQAARAAALYPFERDRAALARASNAINRPGRLPLSASLRRRLRATFARISGQAPKWSGRFTPVGASLLTALAFAFGPDVAHAQAGPRPSASAFSRATIGDPPPAPCVQVDIAGHRAGHLDCATQALTQAGKDARRQAEAARGIPVAQAGSPDVVVGVASRAGTRLRLRENFGVSVRPPTVPTPVQPNPMGRRP